MKKILAVLVLVALCFGACFALACCGNTADFTVGICQLVTHDALDSATQGFKDALTAELAKAGKTVKFDEQNAAGDANTCTTIMNNFVSKQVDLIMANATPALQAAASATLTIPVLGTSVTEYGVALGLTNFNGTVGGNISGTSDLAPLADQAKMITDIFPSAKTVGILYCSSEANSKYQHDVMKTELEKSSVSVKGYTFTDSNDIATVLGSITGIDVLYLPTDNTVAANMPTIDSKCREKELPVICGEEGTCKQGGVATLSISYYNIGVETGKMAAKILLGEADIATMPVAYDNSPVYKYNKEMVDLYGITTIPQNYQKIEK